MKALSIIGTRPQYIKLKPLFDRFLKSDIDHIVADTCQHFTFNVSKSIIKDLNLKIDYFLEIKNTDEISFLSSCISEVSSLIKRVGPDLVVVFGDTNTTFCASLVCHKLGIRLAHIEAGERSRTKIPEEINRIYTDSVSDIHFCSDKSHMRNVENPIHSGDLEYELLNNLNPNISYGDFSILTIHRQENMEIERMTEIFDFLKNIKIRIKLPIHHRTKSFIQKNNLSIPENISVENPYSYSEMVENMSRCRFIITDSGGVHKCSPFFGKKSLILRSAGQEWSRTYREEFSMRYDGSKKNISWLEDFRIERDRYFYIRKDKMPSQIILENMQ